MRLLLRGLANSAEEHMKRVKKSSLTSGVDGEDARQHNIPILVKAGPVGTEIL